VRVATFDRYAHHDQEVTVTEAVETEKTIPVRHVKIELVRSFEDARDAFESIVPKLDAGTMALLNSGETDRARCELERGPELMIFQSRDHGRVLQIAGQERKALQYDVGNPLTASKMTRHQLPAALYAQFRVALYESEQGHAVFEYDRPSSLFGQFGDAEVTAVAQELDGAIERVLGRVVAGRRNE
jgi:exonuclease VII small subunit